MTIASFAIGSCASTSVEEALLERHEYRRTAMGVEARLVLYAPDQAVADTAAEAAFARIAELEAVMSGWNDWSELSRLNARTGRGPVPVSEDLFQVVARSLELASASNGAFDPALGALVELFRQQRASGVVPSPGEREAALARSGYARVRLSPSPRTIHLLVEGVRLDLGGIGKGWACDRALRVLARHGVPRSIVEIGGDLAAGSPPPGREAWRVAVACGAQRRMIDIVRAGVATSGDTEQFVIEDGVRRSHVIDSRSGRGSTSVRCATVVAFDAATADAAASAICSRGPEAQLPEAAFGPLRRWVE